MLIYAVLLLTSLVAALIFKSIIFVHNDEEIVLERMGKFHKVLSKGFHLVIPFIDTPRGLGWIDRPIIDSVERTVYVKKAKIDLRESSYDMPYQSIMTKDDVLLSMHPLISYQITNSLYAVYKIENLAEGFESLVRDILRAVVGELTMDEAFTSRGLINEKLKSVLNDTVSNWGVTVTRVEILEITKK